MHNTHSHPFMLLEIHSGTQSDQLGLVLPVSEMQDHTSRVLQKLIEKIHYSIMKKIYSASYHEYDVSHKLCRTPPPPVYGLWHPYNYTVTGQ